MATQSERREKTRGALLAAARRLFVENGYAETSTAQILAAAGVSKGALYHHFAAKEEILEAIYVETSKAAIAAAARAVDPGAGPIARLRQSARAWLAEIRKPEVAKILLELGPQALGLRRAKALEDQSSLAALTSALKAAEAAGEIKPPSIDVAARLLNALLAEAALLQIEKGASSRAAAEDGVDRFIESLRLER